jgi:hypothetical protein
MIKYQLKVNFWVFASLALIAGLVFPQYGAIFHGKESIFLMGIIFFNLLGVGVKELFDSLKAPKSLVLSFLALSGVFCAIVFINKEFFNEQVFAGLILASTSAISFSSLLIANIYTAEKPRLFIITLLSLVVSAFTIPLFFPEANTFDLLLDTAYFLFLPVFFAGLFRISPYGEYIEKHGSYFSIILFALLLYSLVSSVSGLKGTFFVFILAICFNVLNIFFGLVIGKTKSEKISFAFSTILRNFEFPLLFAVTAFQTETAIVLMIFMIVSYIFIPPTLFLLSKIKN